MTRAVRERQRAGRSGPGIDVPVPLRQVTFTRCLAPTAWRASCLAVLVGVCATQADGKDVVAHRCNLGADPGVADLASMAVSCEDSCSSLLVAWCVGSGPVLAAFPTALPLVFFAVPDAHIHDLGAGAALRPSACLARCSCHTVTSIDTTRMTPVAACVVDQGHVKSRTGQCISGTHRGCPRLRMTMDCIDRRRIDLRASV